MQILNYEFQEAPLITDLGEQAFLVDGEAEIAFDRDGQWHVASVSIEFFNKKTGVWRTRTLCPKSFPTYYGPIVDELEGPRRSYIQSKVDAANEEDGVTYRSDRQLHSTLNSVQQGV